MNPNNAKHTISKRPANVDELRARIDAGCTGDKVPSFDPAAVPLGTDDEAAGSPVDPEAVVTALENESAHGRARPPLAFIPAPKDKVERGKAPETPRGNYRFDVLGVVIFLIIVCVVGAFLMFGVFPH